MSFQPKRNTPWAEIREEYETTPISIRFLATRWGSITERAIRKRRDKEGWNRKISAITATLVTNAMVDHGADHGADHDADHGADHSEPPPPPKPIPMDRGADHAHTRPPARRRPGPQTPIPPVEPAPSIAERREIASQQRDREEAEALKTAKSLATIHTDAIREQAALGDEMRVTGQMIMSRIQAVLGTSDPEERRDAQRALLSLNPDKDSLGTLVAAAAKLIESGVAMKRRSLGMDVLSRPGQVAASGPVLTQPMEAVLREMPEEALMQLRNAAERISRLPAPKRAPTIDGKVTEEATT